MKNLTEPPEGIIITVSAKMWGHHGYKVKIWTSDTYITFVKAINRRLASRFGMSTYVSAAGSGIAFSLLVVMGRKH